MAEQRFLTAPARPSLISPAATGLRQKHTLSQPWPLAVPVTPLTQPFNTQTRLTPPPLFAALHSLQPALGGTDNGGPTTFPYGFCFSADGTADGTGAARKLVQTSTPPLVNLDNLQMQGQVLTFNLVTDRG